MITHKCSSCQSYVDVAESRFGLEAYCSLCKSKFIVSQETRLVEILLPIQDSIRVNKKFIVQSKSLLYRGQNITYLDIIGVCLINIKNSTNGITSNHASLRLLTKTAGVIKVNGSRSFLTGKVKSDIFQAHSLIAKATFKKRFDLILANLITNESIAIEGTSVVLHSSGIITQGKKSISIKEAWSQNNLYIGTIRKNFGGRSEAHSSSEIVLKTPKSSFISRDIQFTLSMNEDVYALLIRHFAGIA